MSAPPFAPLAAGPPAGPPEDHPNASPERTFATPYPVNAGGPAIAPQAAPARLPGAQNSANFPDSRVTAEQYAALVDQQMQRILDKLAPYQLYRWLGLGALLGLFFLRMFLIHGFYIVTYVLLIFILNQFILFLQPKDRASLIARRAATGTDGAREGGNSDSDPAALPTRDSEEFRPFVRRLPEFQMWHSVSVATVCSILATFFPICDVPVFWPVLVFYFILLFVATMRRQWLDMKQLKYVPWDIGSKKTYKSDPKRLSVKPRDAATVVRAQMDSGALNGAGTASQGPGGAPPPVPTIKRAPVAKQSVA